MEIDGKCKLFPMITTQKYQKNFKDINIEVKIDYAL